MFPNKHCIYVVKFLFLGRRCASRQCLKCCTLLNASWVTDSISLIKICSAIIQSRLDNAFQIYGSVGFSYLKKMYTVHHTALWICSGAFCMSPVVSLFINCVEPPPYLVLEQLFFRITLFSLTLHLIIVKPAYQKFLLWLCFYPM